MTDKDQPAFTLLPVEPQRFVGRLDEARAIFERAGEDPPPLQSLDGPSRIGRTSMLRYLQAVCRGEVGQELGFASDRCIAPHFDLTFFPHRNLSVRQEILEAIVTEIAKVVEPAELPDLPALDSLDTTAAVGEVASIMLRAVAANYSFLLLMDHAEYLLMAPRDEESGRAAWRQRAVEVLGELTEVVEGVAVLVALGTTGPGKDLRAQGRRIRMFKSLDALSKILNQGYFRNVTLGTLAPAEVREYGEGACVRGPGDLERKLSEDEVGWIVEVSAGHPLVMQNAGIHLAELGEESSAGRREELALQLADGLQGFVTGAFRRIGAVNLSRASELSELAESGSGVLDRELAASLEEEGLVRSVAGQKGAVTMPSIGLREALLEYLEGERQSASLTAPGSRTQIRLPGATLELLGDVHEKTVRLTRGEHALIKALLAAPEGEVVSREVLKAALGPGTEDPQLNQRISVLRIKLSDKKKGLGLEEPIEGVYRGGYRLADSARLRLRPLG